MNYLDEVKKYYSQDLEQRKNWYFPVADAYNKGRPRYSKELINRVVELAHLTKVDNILEVGCGPGNATISFASMGFTMLCLEPNQAFCHLARQNCASYLNVEIQQTSFEEWQVEPEKFDAVLAANSFHWISPEVKYIKAAAALKDDGYLILLWNMTPQPQYDVYQALSEVYQAYAPSLARYEDREFQENVINALGTNIIDSGIFRDLVTELVPCELTYNIDNYLSFLDSGSPYLKLDPEIKNLLFTGLREKIEQNYGGIIQTSYLSACHIARKC
ncbi:class I SAM-dependent methyltransferase [Nostoc sp. FACHB-152]|uniref:class I SAM-dependent methyltransferase n=1 Tax=unclassified Nostoc TaxID=2593658 RepID=UPI001683DDBE|nr:MULTISPECIES: class I SAM-dependent methyltransferase [unclassified Nostoc]MBD2447711.1 class I SAM-dependent methyltransferase [Nostoc sp. FACHB-152]MBD2467003.1 class I SAM-dependent methyltransferase [Nostoc sp. FACHB-145]